MNELKFEYFHISIYRALHVQEIIMVYNGHDYPALLRYLTRHDLNFTAHLIIIFKMSTILFISLLHNIHKKCLKSINEQVFWKQHFRAEGFLDKIFIKFEHIFRWIIFNS